MNVNVFDSGSICIHGKEFPRQFTFHRKHRRKSHLKKQVFDTSEKLISEQSDEIYGVTPINWEDSSWKRVSLVSDEEVIQSLACKGLRIFRFCAMSWKPVSNTASEQQLDWFKVSSQYRALDTIDEEPMEFEWNIFPRFTSLQLIQEVQKFMNKMSEPAQLQGRIIFMSMFNDIIWVHGYSVQTITLPFLPCVGEKMLFSQQEYNRFRCITWNTRGLIGSPTSPQLTRERQLIYFTRLIMNNDITSVAILAQEAFPVRRCTVFFPFTSVSGFALSKCLQPSFVVSHLFSWHVRVRNGCARFSVTCLFF